MRMVLPPSLSLIAGKHKSDLKGEHFRNSGSTWTRRKSLKASTAARTSSRTVQMKQTIRQETNEEGELEEATYCSI